MTFTVQLFASLAEAAGARQVEVAVAGDATTAAVVAAAVFDRYPALAGMRESVIRCGQRGVRVAGLPGARGGRSGADPSGERRGSEHGGR